MRLGVRELRAMKRNGERIVMVTAYDHPSAALAARAGINLLLVGDSLGMVVHGHDSTVPVTLDDMVRHAAAVVRGAPEALVVGDLPFLSYATPAEAAAGVRRLMQEAGVQAIKLEGGAPFLDTVRHLSGLGVPVMAHLGFTPQSQHLIGVRVQGKGEAEARRLVEDALAMERAGAVAVVLELVPAPLAAAISARLSVPTIGIGAGAGCDGQVQVWHDLLGLFPGRPPRHAGRYAELGDAVVAALSRYAADVREARFPTEGHSARMDDATLAAALDGLPGPLPVR
ncbi:MAG: 3-methyl-2-oxobutanoate hydroxymethyltransferase [Gluconacetobacter diazotrophicus]|nr:3-methyl-2-oxobutanoate hydroxymethyltransferase [Gluconacetobacter diazotrophicus]